MSQIQYILRSSPCIAFRGSRRKRHQCSVIDGVVRVWDPIAGYYTTCHRMPEGMQRRLVLTAEMLRGSRFASTQVEA
jgi:hypothetical protein